MSAEDSDFQMTPKRPYLLRAFYDWILDNGLTPHVLVDASVTHVKVPRQYVKNGSIVLNLNPSAIHNVVMDNDAVSFQARFSGTSFSVYLPMPAIKAVYARENQQGAYFHDAEYSDADQASLSVVQNDDDNVVDDVQEGLTIIEGGTVEPSPVESSSDDDSDRPPRNRPTLRIVK